MRTNELWPFPNSILILYVRKNQDDAFPNVENAHNIMTAWRISCWKGKFVLSKVNTPKFSANTKSTKLRYQTHSNFIVCIDHKITISEPPCHPSKRKYFAENTVWQSMLWIKMENGLWWVPNLRRPTRTGSPEKLYAFTTFWNSTLRIHRLLD